MYVLKVCYQRKSIVPGYNIKTEKQQIDIESYLL